MRKLFIGSVLFLFISAHILFAETANAILISLDGARKERIAELLADDKLPAIKELKATGAFVDITIAGHDTETGPGHAQILTGLSKEINNVHTNSSYSAIPEGTTIGERLETSLGKDNITTVMVMGKMNYMGSRSPADFTAEEKEKWWGDFTQPYFNAKKNIDIWDGDASQITEAVGAKGLGYLEKIKDKRFFMFLHFKDTDTIGHERGENSNKYKGMLVLADSWIEKLMNKLKELGLYEKTLIYVTADHSWDKGLTSHKNAPNIFLVTNDKTVKMNGAQEDIAPTILKQFGVDLSKLEPKFSGKPLN